MPKKSKSKKEPWGVWIPSLNTWLEDVGRKPATYRTRKEAQKDCNEFNGAWRGRKHTYEPKRF